MLMTHVNNIKNSNAFSDGVHYMTHQFEEKYNDKGNIACYEPIIGENGKALERDPDTYMIASIDGNGQERNVQDFQRECVQTFIDNGKSYLSDNKKVDHYVLSFNEKDTENLTRKEVYQLGLEVGKETFEGHQFSVCAHFDTDNYHVHFIVNSCRQYDREKQDYMDKNKAGEIYPAEYKAGGKHRDTPQFNRYCNDILLQTAKEHGLELEDWNAVRDKNKMERPETAMQKKEWMHNAILMSAERAGNYQELKKRLRENYGIEFDMRGSSPRFLYPGMKSFQRGDKLGITPRDLTPDLHHHYKPERDDKVHEQWQQRHEQPQPQAKKAMTAEELTALERKKAEEIAERLLDNYLRYRASSSWNEDGTQKTLTETMLKLAVLIISNGEVNLDELRMSEAQKESIAQHAVELAEKSIQRYKRAYEPVVEQGHCHELQPGERGYQKSYEHTPRHDNEPYH